MSRAELASPHFACVGGCHADLIETLPHGALHGPYVAHTPEKASIMTIRRSAPAAILFASTLALGCGGALEEEEPEELELGRLESAIAIPPKGSATTLDVGSWNIEWFGDTGNGPSNETLQRDNARDVINGTDFDIWGVAEIVSQSQWNSLESALPGYSGFLAKEANVVNGSAFYTDFSNTEQNVGILYKSAVAALLDARVILTANDSDFAGRPPLQVTLRVTLNGATEDIIVIVLHAKCCSDNTSWQRRRNAALALKSYLEANHGARKVWVIGDFNDDVDTSITPGQASAYANFVSDTANYRFPTQALSDAGIASTVDFPDMIDHHLITNEVLPSLVSGSAEVYRVDQHIPNYAATTSDHYPVLSRYAWAGGGPGGAADVIINEVCANEPGSDTSGEFVELLNVGGAAASLGGWTLRDASGVRHTFASGTTLAAGRALAVFGGSSGIPGGLSNAISCSTGTLSLANGGDTVTLADAGGTAVDGLSYSSSLASSDGVSINLNPDGATTGAFVEHNTISSLSRSAGKRASGANW